MQTYLQNLQSGLFDLFNNDPRVIFLGEDVIDPYGGAFKVSSGLSTKFPGRVVTTPISEAGITGVATGLALRGYVPLVEIMFGDFLTLCADQIVNHATKFTQMYQGVSCPLIVRTPMGGGRGYGPTHSQSLEKMFLGIPGLKIIAASHFHQPGQVLQAIVAKESAPVIFIEHKLLYREVLQSSGEGLFVNVLDDESGYQTAVVKNYAEGVPDICLIGYGGTSRWLPQLLRNMAAEEIRVICALPAVIDPFPSETLARIARQANRVVIMDEAYQGFNWGDGVAALLYAKLWGSLFCPINVVSSDRRIIPTSFEQEEQTLISPEKIEQAILETLAWG